MRALDPQPTDSEERPAQVLARWNSWVRVWFPDTDETMWVDLREVEHEAMGGAEPQPGY